MRRPLVLCSLAAVLLAACSGSTPPPRGVDLLADQADRVAQLLEEGRGCAAEEALRTLDAMADDRVTAEVRDTVASFASSAQQAVTCPPPGPTQAPSSPSPQDRDDDEDGKDKDKDDDEDEDEDDEHPGQGRGRGRGGGNDD